MGDAGRTTKDDAMITSWTNDGVYKYAGGRRQSTSCPLLSTIYSSYPHFVMP